MGGCKQRGCKQWQTGGGNWIHQRRRSWVIFNTSTYAEEKVYHCWRIAWYGDPESRWQIHFHRQWGWAWRSFIPTIPEGSVSIISVENGYSVTTINFASFARSWLHSKQKDSGCFGPVTIWRKMEPEYISVAADSKNRLGNLTGKQCHCCNWCCFKIGYKILPLGFKDYNKKRQCLWPIR